MINPKNAPGFALEELLAITQSSHKFVSPGNPGRFTVHICRS